MNHFAAAGGECDAGTSSLRTLLGPQWFCWSLGLLLIRERGGALRGVFQALGWLTVKPIMSEVNDKLRGGDLT